MGEMSQWGNCYFYSFNGVNVGGGLSVGKMTDYNCTLPRTWFIWIWKRNCERIWNEKIFPRAISNMVFCVFPMQNLTIGKRNCEHIWNWDKMYPVSTCDFKSCILRFSDWQLENATVNTFETLISTRDFKSRFCVFQMHNLTIYVEHFSKCEQKAVVQLSQNGKTIQLKSGSKSLSYLLQQYSVLVLLFLLYFWRAIKPLRFIDASYLPTYLPILMLPIASGSG